MGSFAAPTDVRDRGIQAGRSLPRREAGGGWVVGCLMNYYLEEKAVRPSRGYVAGFLKKAISCICVSAENLGIEILATGRLARIAPPSPRHRGTMSHGIGRSPRSQPPRGRRLGVTVPESRLGFIVPRLRCRACRNRHGCALASPCQFASTGGAGARKHEPLHRMRRRHTDVSHRS